eukprot:TRINITY_DN9421_c0_g1_i3.p1 TRINITY_DN9421_c0_g1~~TRINITY_DN9421_c0_g1_i3.p1  ORF type:complete len:113 (+),score=5.75 TRINITY_DN9421_c0_g1_i3:195-533(+)
MGCWASVHQNEIGVVERCGRFQSFQQPGFSCLFPIIDNLVGTLDLRVQQFKMKTESKSRDNVFVTVSVSSFVSLQTVLSAFIVDIIHKLFSRTETSAGILLNLDRRSVPCRS